MIAYIIRSFLCGLALLLLYKGLLQGEKCYRFNRFYLLFSMVAMLVIPMIRIDMSESLPAPVLPALQYVSVPEQAAVALATKDIPSHSLPLWKMFYLLITALLLIRFVHNLVRLLKQVARLEKATYRNRSVLLLPDGSGNYTFLHHIFISRSDYENREQESRIIDHEIIHAEQKHSWDILFTELLLVCCWFNPLLILYKKRIQLNHEFLADDAVKGNGSDSFSYQYLVLAKAGAHASVNMTSSFHYTATKKRLIMMNRSSSLRKFVLKLAVLLPALTIVITGITAEAPAKLFPADIASLTGISVATERNTPQSLIGEMLLIRNRYMAAPPAVRSLYTVTAADRQRLETIFLQLSPAEQATAPVRFLASFVPPGKIIPTADQLDKWKDAAVYGVWIDGKKVSNETLSDYTPSDFSHYAGSKLSGTAQKNNAYTVQLNLMTNAYYQEFREKRLKNKRSSMMFVFPRQGKTPVMIGVA